MYTFDDLVGIIAKLRSPEGCPWDREQTFESLKKCLADEAQEVFEALLRSGKRFREPEHLRAWLLRVTVNKCKNLYRAKRRTEVPLTEAIPAPEAAEPSVLDEVRALPAPYRSTLYLHYFEGYTAAEIGRILGAKRNTVLSWLARGRQALRERMIGGFDDA